MKHLLSAALLSALMSGCAYSITEVDTSRAAPMCVRECTGSYSTCVTGGPVIGSKGETLRACRDAYSVCVSTCPPK